MARTTMKRRSWPPKSLPSHCRTDHGTIGYIHTEWPDEERCPVCRLQNELDAERAAHEATRIGSYSAETMGHMVEECDRLKARLALAEAVCDAAPNAATQPITLAIALAAWRAAK